MWPVATILDNANTEYFHHLRKFYQIAWLPKTLLLKSNLISASQILSFIFLGVYDSKTDSIKWYDSENLHPPNPLVTLSNFSGSNESPKEALHV